MDLSTKVDLMKKAYEDMQKLQADAEALQAKMTVAKGKYDEALSATMKDLGFEEKSEFGIHTVIERAMEKGKDLPRLIM